MHLRSSVWMSIAFSLLVVGSIALAEGRGQGLNRALAAATRGSSNSGLARAGQSAARSQNGLSRGASLGRSANGLNRATSGLSHSQAISAQTSNSTRIRDKRLQQAEHLRNVSERNGNERLIDTADRMQESAQRNFLRGVGDGTNESGSVETTGATRVDGPKKSRSSSWLPAWMRSTP